MLFVIFKYFLYTAFKVDVFEYPLNFSKQNKNRTKCQFANTVILIDLRCAHGMAVCLFSNKALLKLWQLYKYFYLF
jgi:hypothetical protein